MSKRKNVVILWYSFTTCIREFNKRTDRQFFRNKTQVYTKSLNSKFAEDMETGWVIIHRTYKDHWKQKSHWFP